MGKLPSRTNRVSKRSRPQPDNDLLRTLLRVAGRYTAIWKPKSRRMVRCFVDVNAYQRKRMVTRSKSTLDVGQAQAGIFRECYWTMTTSLVILSDE